MKSTCAAACLRHLLQYKRLYQQDTSERRLIIFIYRDERFRLMLTTNSGWMSHVQLSFLLPYCCSKTRLISYLNLKLLQVSLLFRESFQVIHLEFTVHLWKL